MPRRNDLGLLAQCCGNDRAALMPVPEKKTGPGQAKALALEKKIKLLALAIVP